MTARVATIAASILALLAVAPSTLAPRLGAQADGFVLTRLDGLASAPYPPVDGAPQVIVSSPAATVGETVDVVLHLHGYEGCVEVLVLRGRVRCRAGAREQEGWDLAGAHAEARTQSWLVVPQLAFDTRDGSPGRLAREGGARALLDETIARVAEARGIATPRLGRVVVTAHSAGFEATIAVIRRGGLGDALRHVVLFDAMYSGVGTFGAWAAADPRRSLVAFHTATGTPSRRAGELTQRYRRPLGDRLRAGERVDEGDIAPGRVVSIRARTGHRAVPRRYFAPTIGRLLTGASG